MDFLAYMPLSNWLHGFDRYRFAFDKAMLPRARYPDCWYVLPIDAPAEHHKSVLEKTAELVDRLDVQGDRIIAVKARLPVDGEGTVAEPNTHTGTGIGWRWPGTILPIQAVGVVDDMGEVRECPHETITASAYRLDVAGLKAWNQCAPRTFSVLPIAQACNASCQFCFSKASVSELPRQAPMDMALVRQWAGIAAARGATRAVITGGGEPALLKHEGMVRTIQALASGFNSILLITNGHMVAGRGRRHGLENATAMLGQWRQAGLTRIAYSRHGADEAADARIMGLEVDGDAASRAAIDAGLGVRLICVLQKGGVEDADGIGQYLRRAAGQGIDQVCFKELYVSALSENPWASSRENAYCQAHQVPLSTAIDALEAMGMQACDRLPWGSRVYTGMVGGVQMRVAAYTEPSVGWERSHGLARSWNLLADGKCMASLEDPGSVLHAAEYAMGLTCPQLCVGEPGGYPDCVNQPAKDGAIARQEIPVLTRKVQL